MNIVERLRKRNVPYGWLGLADAAADRIEALEAALREIIDLRFAPSLGYAEAARIARAALTEGQDK